MGIKSRPKGPDFVHYRGGGSSSGTGNKTDKTMSSEVNPNSTEGVTATARALTFFDVYFGEEGNALESGQQS